MADRRTALSNSEHAKNAIEQRWHPGEEYSVIDVDHRVSDSEAKPPKTRIRAQVAKQASVSERWVQAVAAADPAAYERIPRGESTIRDEKAAINKRRSTRRGARASRGRGNCEARQAPLVEGYARATP